MILRGRRDLQEGLCRATAVLSQLPAGPWSARLPLPSSPHSIPAAGAGMHSRDPGAASRSHRAALDLQSSSVPGINYRLCCSCLQPPLYNLSSCFASPLQEPLVNPKSSTGDCPGGPSSLQRAWLVPSRPWAGLWHCWHHRHLAKHQNSQTRSEQREISSGAGPERGPALEEGVPVHCRGGL